MIIYFLRMWRSKSFQENKKGLVKLKEEIESCVVRTVCGFASFKCISSFQIIVVKIQLELFRVRLFQFRKSNERCHINGQSSKFIRIVWVCLNSQGKEQSREKMFSHKTSTQQQQKYFSTTLNIYFFEIEPSV